MTSQPHRRRGGLAAGVSAAALIAAAPALGQALPTGGVVTAGAASMQAAGGVLTVTQATARADLNWQTFDIGAGGRVVFAQPSADAVAVNRVLSGGPSAILGSLEANGRVFLLNPNGVVFRQGAQVNVGGLVAAAGDLAGDPLGAFQITTAPGGAVSNAGQIAAGGGVLLVGERVVNAPSGAIRGAGVTLAAGRQASVALDPQGLVRLRVDQGAVDAAVASQGVIVAPGGQVLLTAQGVAAAVEAGGRISTDGQGGGITLDAGPDGRTRVDGALEATSATGRGGEITLQGGEIAVGGAARLDASGARGGGAIRVGGGAHGEGLSHNARTVRVAEGAELSADADVLGDGGTVVVWADGTADITGRFTARGGRDGGNGGFVETSGRETLRIGDATRVDTLAPHGAAGDWLLDPTTITIDAGGTGTLGDASGGASGAVTINPSTINGATSNVILSATTSITQTAGANIAMTGSGFGITFQGATAGSAPSAGTTLAGSIQTTNGAILINGGLTLGADTTLNSGTAATTITGTVNSGSGGSYSFTRSGNGATTLGGAVGGTKALSAFAVSGTGAVSLTGGVTTNGGAVSLGGALNLSGDTTINTAGGAMTFTGAVNAQGSTPYALTLSGSGAVTFGSPVGTTRSLSSLTTTSGTTTISGGGIRTTTGVTVNGPLALNSDLTIASGSGATVIKGQVTGNGRSLSINTSSAAPVSLLGGAGTSGNPLAAVNIGVVTADPNPAAGITLSGTFHFNGGTSSSLTTNTFGQAVTLAGDTSIVVGATAGARTIVFGHGIEATTDGGQSFTFATTSNKTINLYLGDPARLLSGSPSAVAYSDAAVGQARRLSSFSSGATETFVLQSVATSGSQTYKRLSAGPYAVIMAAGNISIDGGGVSSLAVTSPASSSATRIAAGAFAPWDSVQGYPSGYTLPVVNSAATLTIRGNIGALTQVRMQGPGGAVITGDIGSSAAPAGTIYVNAPLLTFGSAQLGSGANIWVSSQFQASGDVRLMSSPTWTGGDSRLNSFFVQGNLNVNNLTIQSRGIVELPGAVSGTSLTVTGYGGYTPNAIIGSVGTAIQPLNAGLDIELPVTIGPVYTTNRQTYARGGTFTGVHQATLDGITLLGGPMPGGTGNYPIVIMPNRNAGITGASFIGGGPGIVQGTFEGVDGANLTLEMGDLSLNGPTTFGTGDAPLGDLRLAIAGGIYAADGATPADLGDPATGSFQSITGVLSGGAITPFIFKNVGAFGIGDLTVDSGGAISSATGDINITGLVRTAGNLSIVAGANGVKVAHPGDVEESGNIIIGNGGAIQRDASDSVVKLYTGSLTASTGLVGAGRIIPDGQSRYHVDGSDTLSLYPGVWALFREQPTATLAPATADGGTIYNGQARTGVMVAAGLIQGDTVAGSVPVDVKDAGGQAVATFTNAGTYTFTPTGDPSSSALASAVSALGYAVNFALTPQSFTLGRAPLTITGASAVSGGAGAKTYTAIAQTNTYSVTGLFSRDSLTGVNGRATGTAAGSYADTLSGAAGSGLDNYNITYVNGRLVIDRAPLTITSGTTSLTYNGAARSNTFTATGLLGSDTVTAVAGLASGTTVGSYADAMTAASGSGLANYSISFVNGGGLTITKAPLTVTGATASRVYSGGVQINGYSITGGQLFGSDRIDSLTGAGSGTGIGSYSDSLTGAVGQGLGNYDITFVNGGLTITRAALTIAGSTASRTYSGAAQTNGFTATGLLGSDTVTGVSGRATGTDAGAYADALSGAVGSGLANYDITYANGGLTITRAALTITGRTGSQTYTGLAQTNTFGVSGLLGGDTVTAVTGLATGTNAGRYADTLSGAVGAGLANYDITYANGALTISPASLTVTYTAATATSVYGEPLAAGLTGAVAGAGFVNGETTAVLGGSASWTTTATAGAPAGAYRIDGGGLTSSNYAITSVQAVGNASAYTITRAPLTITGATTSRVYIGGVQVNGYSITGGRLFGTDRIDNVTGLGSGTGVGAYADSLTGVVGQGLGNYDITLINGGLTITKAPLTITGATASRTYTAAAQTNGFTTAGLLGSDTVTGVSGRATGTDAGRYIDALSGATGSGLANYDITYANGVLTIDRAPLTITGRTGSQTYTGLAQTNSFTTLGLLGADTVTGVSGLATGTGAGRYVDILSGAAGAGLANYDITYANGALTISPAALTLTYTAAAATSVYGQPLAAGLTGAVAGAGFVNGETLAVLGGAATWTTTATAGAAAGVYRIDGGGLTSANYAVTAVQAAGNAAAYSISRAALTVTGATASRVYSGAVQTNGFSITSGRLFGSDRINSLTGLGSGTGVGTYADTLTGAVGQGLGNYDITFVNGGLTITKAPLTIIGASTSRVYSGAAQTNVFTAVGLLGGDTVTAVSGLASGTGAGRYVDALSGAAGTGLDNYDIAYANGSLTITRAPLTIAGRTASQTYSGLAQSNTFTVTGLLGADTVTGVIGLAAGTNAGRYVDALSGATGLGLGNYDIRYDNGALTITGAPLTLTYTAATATSVYGQPLAAGLTGAVTAAGFVNGETPAVLAGSAAWTTSAAAGASVGAYAITGAGLTSSNYVITAVQAAGNASAYTITRAPLTITGASTSRVYNGAAQTNVFSITGGRLFGSDRIDSVTGLGSGTSAGVYADTLTGAVGQGLANYDITFVNGGLTINRAPLTLTGATTSRVYSGAAQVNGFAVTSGRLFGADRIDSLTGLASGTGVGTYADNLTAAAGQGLANYDITFVNGGLTVTKAPLTIAGATGSRTYAGVTQSNTFTATGLLAGDTVTGVRGLAAGTGVGRYVDTLAGATGAGLANYDITYANGTLTITPASLTLTYTAAPGTQVYGQAPQGGLTGSVSGSGFVNGEGLGVLTGSAAWTTSAAAGSPVGAYAITGGGLSSFNYAITAVQAPGNSTAYSVTRASLTITGGTGSVVYNGQSQSNTFTASGLVGADRVDGVAGLASGVRVGAYSDALSGAFGVGLQNYNVTYVNGAFSIRPAPLTISGATASRTYSGAAQVNGFTTTGLLGRDTVTSVAGLASGTSVGVYADALSGAAGVGLENYTITYVNGRLTIDRAPLVLTYTAGAASSVYGNDIAAVSGVVSAAGFVGGDTLSALGGTATWSTAAASGLGVGAYAITGGGLTSANYDIDVRQADGNARAYAITPRPITGVTGVAVADKVFDGTLAATADVTGAVLAGLIRGDAVRLAPVTAVFTSTGPGAGIPVTVTLNGLVGAAAANYVLVPATVTATATITAQRVSTPAPLYQAAPARAAQVTAGDETAAPAPPLALMLRLQDSATIRKDPTVICAKLNDDIVCRQAVPATGFRVSLQESWRLE